MKPRAVSELREGDIVEGPRGQKYLLASSVNPTTGKAEWVLWAARKALEPKEVKRIRGNIAELIGREAAEKGVVNILEDIDLGLA